MLAISADFEKKSQMTKYLSKLLNTRAAGLYILLFAFAIAAGTFVENDFGTSAAQKNIYRATWFEVLLLLFCLTLIYNIYKFRMIQTKRWALLAFHTSMVIIIIGAGVTRYFGSEGMMHIRENSRSNTFLSAKSYFRFDVSGKGEEATFYEPAEFASLGSNKWHESYQVGEDLIDVRVKEFVPNPKKSIIDDADGTAILKIVVAGMGGRQEYFLEKGKTMTIQGLLFNFKDTNVPGAVNISMVDGSPLIQADFSLSQMVMATRVKSDLTPRETPYPLRLRSMYSNGKNNFVFGDFKPSGKVVFQSDGIKVKRSSTVGLVLDVSINGDTKEVTVYGNSGQVGTPASISGSGLNLAISYGARDVPLPFSIALKKFILEKYPGTDNPSSYASEVVLLDDRNNTNMDYRIFMNHILSYDGYRFFQSSFDQDEKGTYLSVNHDFWGTWISYIGYILLTIGMFLSFFSSKSRFQQLSKMLQKMRDKNLLLILFFVWFGALFAQAQPEIDVNHAEKFSHLIVQDHKGRMKPMHTLSREILRKLYRKESVNGQNADQVILGMYAESEYWQTVPMIKLGAHKNVFKLLKTNDKYISYQDFFDHQTGTYLLRDEVRKAYSMVKADRGVYEKELMKIDERVNVASMAFSGKFLKLIPSGDELNTWQSPEVDHGSGQVLTPVAQKFFTAYHDGLRQAVAQKDYTFVNQLIKELASFQKENGKDVIPSDTKINAEIFLNKLNVFNRLALGYFLLGLSLLILLFVTVFKPNFNSTKAFKILFGIALFSFGLHTLGLGLRWFVSGRAPWSNGYESMIYIAWTSVLAGMIFSRKSIGGMAATMILSATVLLVAFLSYLNPEITPLVPVLKSYWLTIHVSLEAGSYGFLMLGAIIGLINMILLIFLSQKNKDRVKRIIKEMSYISEMTLIGGIFMLSVGTYLGGVWANESWGRYWGWDAKETWALVTILVYAFILHMRIIPKMNGLFLFNTMAILGWASVIMTYYGVNYYLSGLHSYAAGDPVPVPDWVYIVTVVVLSIVALAFYRMKKIGLRV